MQVGATVYGYASNPYSHVGIYIGNGQVVHNLSGTVTVNKQIVKH
ncbi:NlpC/P60 family protein [uncultured Eubacterium sp.]